MKINKKDIYNFLIGFFYCPSLLVIGWLISSFLKNNILIFFGILLLLICCAIGFANVRLSK